MDCFIVRVNGFVFVVLGYFSFNFINYVCVEMIVIEYIVLYCFFFLGNDIFMLKSDDLFRKKDVDIIYLFIIFVDLVDLMNSRLMGGI